MSKEMIPVAIDFSNPMFLAGFLTATVLGIVVRFIFRFFRVFFGELRRLHQNQLS